MRSSRGATVGVALAVAICSLPLPAQAGDFFSNFFGMLGGRPHAPPVALPFGNESNPSDAPRTRASYGGGGPAWCVRSCDRVRLQYGHHLWTVFDKRRAP